MSSRQTVNLACPDCSHPARYALWTGVNVTLEPELKQEVLRQELNRVQCPECEAQFEVVTTMVYHDMEAGVMIELRPEGPEFSEQRQWSSERLREETERWAEQAVHEMGYRLRRVGTMNRLVEKVLVFDEQLDDRVIEVIKLVLSRSAPDTQLFFLGCREPREADADELGSEQGDGGEAQSLLVFERHGPQRHERLTLPRDVYDEMAGKMAPLEQPGPDADGGWPRVDAHFARQFLD